MKSKITRNILSVKPIESKILLEENNKELDLILLNGLGDVIYTYYKLKNIIDEGYKINIFSPSNFPRRAHQIQPVLNGINKFEYIDNIKTGRYRMIDPIDLINPSPNSLFENKPVLHINSFLENGVHIDKYLEKYPTIYDIELNTSDIAKTIVNDNLNDDYFNVILYCSNYTNNKNCKMHPDPKFWVDLCKIIHQWQGDSRKLYVNIVGADYDSDLTDDVFSQLKRSRIKSEKYINEDFENIIEMVRKSDFCICYESGFGMIADVLKTPCLEIFRFQGPPRDDKLFPYLGCINPAGLGNRFFPFFYDDDLQSIKNKLK